MALETPSEIRSARKERWHIAALAPQSQRAAMEQFVLQKLEELSPAIEQPKAQTGLAGILASKAAQAPPKPQTLPQIAQAAVLANLLSQRGIDEKSIGSFLNPPSFEEFTKRVPNLLKLKDMQPAIERLASAIEKGEIIGISGDYDCDGNCSVALLRRALLACGVPEEKIVIHVPNRVIEGYGINREAVRGLRDHNVNLLITLDNGTLAKKPIELARELGMDTIVVDHHPNSLEHGIPQGALVINANRADEAHPDKDLKDLAAVGLTFLMVAGLKEHFARQAKHGGENPAKDLDVRNLLGLVALATVGDVVNVKTSINRFFVNEGLNVIREGGDEAIAHLCNATHIKLPVDEESIAFKLSPVINAPGRLGQSVAWEFLSSDKHTDPTLALKRILSEESNEERKLQEAEVTREARQQARAILMKDPATPVIVMAGTDWPEGVIGIVAGRMKEEFGRPTVVCTQVEDESTKVAITSFPEALQEEKKGDKTEKKRRYKASARSIEGVDIGTAFRTLDEGDDPVFLKAGGHPMAAGAMFKLNKLDTMREKLGALLKDQVDAALQTRSTAVAGVLPLDVISPELIQSFNTLGPFGQGHRKPLVLIPNMEIHDLNMSRDGRHMFMKLEPHAFNPLDRSKDKHLSAVAFHSGGTALEDALRKGQTQCCQLLGTLNVDPDSGQPKLFVEDIYISPNQRVESAGINEILGANAIRDNAFAVLGRQKIGLS